MKNSAAIIHKYVNLARPTKSLRAQLPKLNQIQIQQEYVDTVTAAYERWKHRKGVKNVADGIGGHYARTRYKAHKKAIKQLMAWGYNYGMALFFVGEAHDIVLLERSADC